MGVRVLLGTLLVVGMFYCGVFAATGCGGPEDAVGMACGSHGDCPGYMTCLQGNRYPGGTCSIPCDDHQDCPYYAACIDRNGGVCLPRCERDLDCRRHYECSAESNYGRGGHTDVCIGE
jgi:hypothetical protein